MLQFGDIYHYLHRYIYYDGAVLTADNLLKVMYAAKKYLVDGLVEKCKQFKIVTANVCTILDDAMLYDEEELIDKCVDVVRLNVVEVVESDVFLDVSSKALHKLMSTDIIDNVNVMSIYLACLKWAKHKGSDPDDPESKSGSSLRDHLGSILHHIPFTWMSSKQLSRITDNDPDLLSADEQLLLLKFIVEPSDQRMAALLSLGFEVRKKKLFVTKCRFRNFKLSQSWSQSFNCICFTVNKRIYFAGITMYGTNTPCTEDVKVELCDDETSVNLIEDCVNVTHTGTMEPVQIVLKKGVILTTDITYRIMLSIGRSLYGSGSGTRSSVDTAGVTFTYKSSTTPKFSTDQGQIPQIIFCF